MFTLHPQVCAQVGHHGSEHCPLLLTRVRWHGRSAEAERGRGMASTVTAQRTHLQEGPQHTHAVCPEKTTGACVSVT